MSRRSDWNPDNTRDVPVVSADTIRVDRRRRPPRPASWAHLARGAHAVQFYSQDAVLLDLLSGFIGGALVRGEAAFVIATPVHRHQLKLWPMYVYKTG